MLSTSLLYSVIENMWDYVQSRAQSSVRERDGDIPFDNPDRHGDRDINQP